MVVAHHPRSLYGVLEQRRARAAQHDVEPVGQQSSWHERVAVERRDQPLDRRLVVDRVQDRARRDQRIAFEVHLRDEPLHPARARDRIVDVRRAPVVDAVAPRVGARLDRAVEVVAVVVGQRAAAAAEIRVDRRDVAVLLVPVAAAGVRLPHLDQRIGHGPAISSRTWPWTMIRSPIGKPILRVIHDEVVVERTELVVREHRPGDLRQRVLQRDQRLARRAQHAGLVGRASAPADGGPCCAGCTRRTCGRRCCSSFRSGCAMRVKRAR